MFPAHAGMNREQSASGIAERDVPRARGDEPPYNFTEHWAPQCSPRTRG